MSSEMNDHELRQKLIAAIDLYHRQEKTFSETSEAITAIVGNDPAIHDEWQKHLIDCIEGEPSPPARPASKMPHSSVPAEVRTDELKTCQDISSSKKRKINHNRAMPQKTATLSQKVEVLNWHYANNKNQTKTSLHFSSSSHVSAGWPKITQPLVCSWLKSEQTIRDAFKAGSGASHHAAAAAVRLPDVEKALVFWCNQALANRVILNGEMIRQKASDFAKALDIELSEFLKLSDGWLTSFKARHNLKQYKFHGEASKVDNSTLVGESHRLRTITDDYALKNIFNMDETGLNYAMPPNEGLAREARHGIESKKNRLTYAFCVNADGSEKLPPFIIGKARKPRCFKNKDGQDLGFYYRYNAKAWMTGALFQEWIYNLNDEMSKKDRHILLLLDNFSGHTPSLELSNIRMEFFYPNLTSRIQPLDQGIIRAFKAHYRRLFIRYAITRYESGEADYYAIDQLAAMEYAEEAWESVTQSTIANCWTHAGFLSPRKKDGLTMQERTGESDVGRTGAFEDPELKLALSNLELVNDELVTSHIIPASQKMTIAFLCAPFGEDISGIELFTDAEIVAEVIKNSANTEEIITNNEEEEVEIPEVTMAEAQAAFVTLTRFSLNHRSAKEWQELRRAIKMAEVELRKEMSKKMVQRSLLSFFNWKICDYFGVWTWFSIQPTCIETISGHLYSLWLHDT